MSQQTGAACYYWCGARFYFRLLSSPLRLQGHSRMGIWDVLHLLGIYTDTARRFREYKRFSRPINNFTIDDREKKSANDPQTTKSESDEQTKRPRVRDVLV